MSVIPLCNSIQSTFTHNLKIAVSDQQSVQFAGIALEEIRTKIIPVLNHLVVREREVNEHVVKARQAVLEIITTVSVVFARRCTDFNWGVAIYEQMAAECRDPVVKRKLTTYMNQLKARWNESEPGGIRHTPRAAKKRTLLAAGSIPAWPWGILLVMIFLQFLLRLDPVKAFVRHMFAPSHQAVVIQQQTLPQNREPVRRQEVQNEPQPSPQALQQNEPSEQVAALPTPGDFCTYTDDRGIVHMVNDPSQVPIKYRTAMKVVPAGGSSGNSETHVAVTPQGHVLVPVIIRYHGREVRYTLLLDTGASITGINDQAAMALSIAPGEMKTRTARLADGRQVVGGEITVDEIIIGSRRLSSARLAITPHTGEAEAHDGLLGMNFLKKFRYHVDLDRKVIVWTN